MAKALVVNGFVRQRIRPVSAQANRRDLLTLTGLVEDGKLTPILDRTYPLADAALIRKMEGAEITLERLEYVVRATQNGKLREQVFSAFIGESQTTGYP